MASLGNARIVNEFTDQWVRDMEAVVSDFEKKDQQKILRRAARPVVKASRRMAPVSDEKHYRYKRRRGNFEKAARRAVSSRRKSSHRKRSARGSRREIDASKIEAVYFPTNLQKALRSLTFRRSRAVFVGPKIGTSVGVKEYGKTAAKVDAYYAAMIYGSAERFRARILEPALNAGRAAAIAEAQKMRTAILDRAAKKGLT